MHVLECSSHSFSSHFQFLIKIPLWREGREKNVIIDYRNCKVNKIYRHSRHKMINLISAASVSQLPEGNKFLFISLPYDKSSTIKAIDWKVKIRETKRNLILYIDSKSSMQQKMTNFGIFRLRKKRQLKWKLFLNHWIWYAIHWLCGVHVFTVLCVG